MLLSIIAAALAFVAADVGFALAGGFPDTYRAARPFPGAEAGKRRARTVESLGMISVSSVYSINVSNDQSVESTIAPTLIRILLVYLEIEIGTIS